MTVKQFKAISEKGEELTSFVGESKEKFETRMKKQGHNIKEYTNQDVSISDEGLILLGKIMPMFEKLVNEIKVVEHNIKIESEYDKMQAENKGVGDTDGSVQSEVEASE